MSRLNEIGERMTRKNEGRMGKMREILFKAKGQTSDKWNEGLLTRLDKDYGALWKLMGYEDTGLSPEDVERISQEEQGKLLM